jgi:hypothetical protein
MNLSEILEFVKAKNIWASSGPEASIAWSKGLDILNKWRKEKGLIPTHSILGGPYQLWTRSTNGRNDRDFLKPILFGTERYDTQ